MTQVTFSSAASITGITVVYLVLPYLVRQLHEVGAQVDRDGARYIDHSANRPFLHHRAACFMSSHADNTGTGTVSRMIPGAATGTAIVVVAPRQQARQKHYHCGFNATRTSSTRGVLVLMLSYHIHTKTAVYQAYDCYCVVRVHQAPYILMTRQQAGQKHYHRGCNATRTSRTRGTGTHALISYKTAVTGRAWCWYVFR